MDKRTLIVEKFQRIRSEIPVSEVALMFMALRRYGASLKGLCPFHSDHRIGSFVITDSKNIWKCFSCGEGGDNIKFYALKTNQRYYEAGLELGYMKGIISLDEYDMLKTYRISNKEKNKVEKLFIEKDRVKFQQLRAEIETLDKVYKLFIKGNEYLGKPKLSVEHYRHLREERKLSDEDIERRGYFTFPTRHILKYVLKEIENEGIDLEVLKKVPGFFYDKSKGNYSFMTVKGGGLGIPLYNNEGLIEAIQIRKDVTEIADGKESGKYFFFSSSFAMNYDTLEGGVGCGSPVDVLYPQEGVIPSRAMILTEGIFKGEIACKTFNTITLSTQGVTSWKNTVKCVENIRKKFQHKYVLDTMIIAYDADLGFNLGVLEQAIKTGLTYRGYNEDEVYKMTQCTSLKEANLLKETDNSTVYFALWDVEKGKGIDDLILNGHKSSIRKISLESMYNLYMEYKENVYGLIADGTFNELKDIPVATMQDFFETIVLSKVIAI